MHTGQYFQLAWLKIIVLSTFALRKRAVSVRICITHEYYNLEIFVFSNSTFSKKICCFSAKIFEISRKVINFFGQCSGKSLSKSAKSEKI